MKEAVFIWYDWKKDIYEVFAPEDVLGDGTKSFFKDLEDAYLFCRAKNYVIDERLTNVKIPKDLEA